MSTETPTDQVEASRLVRVVAGLVLLIVSATFLINVFGIRSPDGLDPAGPRFFPFIVCTAWVLLSAAYILQTLRQPSEETSKERHWFEPVGITVLLVLYAFLVVPLGYVIATALLFFAAARVLGSRNTIRDAVVSATLAIVVYIAFTRFLDIALPEGVLGL